MAHVTGGGDKVSEDGDDLRTVTIGCGSRMLEEPLSELKLMPRKLRMKKVKIARKGGFLRRTKCENTEKAMKRRLREMRASRNYSMGCTSTRLREIYGLLDCRKAKFDQKVDKVPYPPLGQEFYPDWNCVDVGLQLDKVLDPGRECGVKLDEGLQLDKVPDPGQECGVKLDEEEECGIDPEFDPDWNCGFDSDIDPDWNDHHVVSWDEFAVEALHIVRLYEITKEDPVHCLPVRTRFCKFNIALFDFEKESKASHGPPILELTSRDRIKLADSVNIVSFKIPKSDVGYPISVFGTVLVRDQFDYKCIYVFNRDKDNAQVIRSPEDMLALTDPCRGLVVTNGMFFEINLKIKCGDSGETDFSKGVIERDVFVSQNRKLMTRLLTSWHSTVQLAYTPVPFAVAAYLAVNILEGPHDFFIGEISAWTSGNENRIILYDSNVEGTDTSIGDGGSAVLSRCLVAVPVKEDLQLRVCVQEGGCEVACFELTLDHLDDNRICCQGSHEIEVKVEWTAILNRSEEGVLRHVGHTILVV
ncbi:unnamed protein product [Urochloa humidicola]